MDRMNYKGPKWEGIGIPKSVLEEENPMYTPREEEAHPETYAPEKEGKKDYEFVVRWRSDRPSHSFIGHSDDDYQLTTY